MTSLLFGLKANSQDMPQVARTKHNGLSIVPQYIMIQGLRLDYERRLGKGDLWLLVAPQLFIDNYPYNDYYSSSNPYSSYDNMRGLGANIYLKWNAQKSTQLDRLSGLPARLFYIAGGPSYQYFAFNSYREVPVPYLEDGVTYYKFENQKVTDSIQRIGGHFNMGVQFAMDPFFVDLYLGFGVKLSKNQDGETIGLSDSDWLDPSFSGFFFDGGFKFGVYF